MIATSTVARVGNGLQRTRQRERQRETEIEGGGGDETIVASAHTEQLVSNGRNPFYDAREA